jgi:hypothetical protein
MIVRTCLLISDDPDDHIEFSEALYEVSDDAVLVTVSDFKKALDLLTLRKCIPEFVFLNLAIPAFEQREFFDALDDDSVLKNVKVITYGESPEIKSARVTAVLDPDLSYSQLKDFLRKYVGGG